MKKCDAPDCTASFKNHHWGSIKANSDGWMMQKNGACWCPEHLPEWAAGWRAARTLKENPDEKES